MGALPDMVTFTPDGKHALVANEGEPNDAYTVDPEGSVSIVHVAQAAEDVRQSDVRTAGFGQFTASRRSIRRSASTAPARPSPRISSRSTSPSPGTAGPPGSRSRRRTRSASSTSKRGVFTALHGLGFKDWTLPANQLDPSDRDNAIKIANWPVKGMYQPDGIAAYHTQGAGLRRLDQRGRRPRLHAASTRRGGSTRSRSTRPRSRTPRRSATNANLGRLRITSANGDANGDGLYEQLYAYGARSFSIWSARRASSSGTPATRSSGSPPRRFRPQFNSNHETNGSFDTRSDDKGPEPEGVAVGKRQGPLVRVRRARADRRHRRLRHQRPARAAASSST